MWEPVNKKNTISNKMKRREDDLQRDYPKRIMKNKMRKAMITAMTEKTSMNKKL
jgi:hypothetical protein